MDTGPAGLSVAEPLHGEPAKRISPARLPEVLGAGASI
ncbi:hypothetical protein SAMN05216489_00592 [Streptomyces sp. 3213]|nr:hypothetical protein SAMN05216489_00592 [Streptomyces sp. 3213] [Streptomyces sp. 3213.3]